MSKPTQDQDPPDKTSRIGERRKTAQRNGGADYAARRAEIIAAGVTVFREKGYQAATLNDVAERLGTDRASLYYYIADKRELFHGSISGVLDENLKRAEKIHSDADLDPVQRIRALVAVLLESYEASYPQMFVFIQEDMAQILQEESLWATGMNKNTRRMERIFQSAIQDAVDARLFREDISVRLATQALFGMVNWTHRWFEPGRRLRASEIADAFASIFSSGMAR